MSVGLDSVGLLSVGLGGDLPAASVTGTLAASESGADTAAIAGAVIVAGALAASESGADSAAVSGVVRVSGVLDASETGSDTASIAGGGTPGDITGTLSASESADTAAIAGAVRVSGAMAASETGQDTAAIGNTPAATESRFGGFEITDTAPRLWWQKRKDAPAVPEVPVTRKKAKELLREVVIDLAKQHAEEAANEPASEAKKPAPAQVAEVRANVAPILPAVPGVDWQALYQRMYARALEDQQRAAAEMLAAQEDEDAALLLLLA
jgi:hypothetical protein